MKNEIWKMENKYDIWKWKIKKWKMNMKNEKKIKWKKKEWKMKYEINKLK